ncbi:DUF817 family protein [Deinococcus cavernae]|uniref:DUF817 family protein n=1 Tax=Deinococcus cavernae TaxID=2320857 RepID=A0A418VFH9_9DEIO|nr:DUF817 family protein [Deinococcus cavernae]
MRLNRFLLTLAAFTRDQALSCLFALSVIGLLSLSKTIPLNAWGVARYDALLAGCLAVQATLLITRFETMREAGVILLFHLLGFAMEAFKVERATHLFPRRRKLQHPYERHHRIPHPARPAGRPGRHRPPRRPPGFRRPLRLALPRLPPDLGPARDRCLHRRGVDSRRARQPRLTPTSPLPPSGAVFSSWRNAAAYKMHTSRPVRRKLQHGYEAPCPHRDPRRRLCRPARGRPDPGRCSGLRHVRHRGSLHRHRHGPPGAGHAARQRRVALPERLARPAAASRGLPQLRGFPRRRAQHAHITPPKTQATTRLWKPSRPPCPALKPSTTPMWHACAA